MWNLSENQITIVFIRHGITISNKEHRYLGRTDEALSEEGKAALLEQKSKNNYPKIELLFTSPMKRCIETAKLLYPDLQPMIVPEWEEIDFGAFEGKNYQDLKDDIRYQEWIDSNGTLPFPEGESQEEFIKRCVCGFQKMLESCKNLSEKQNQGRQKRIGAIVHGGIIMALLSAYYGGEYFDYQVSNGEGYECVLKEWETGIRFLLVNRF